MVGQEMQRRIGEDEVWLLVRLPARDVALDEARRGRPLARVGEHGVRGVEADDSRVGKAAAQQLRAVTRTAAKIIDEAR